MRGSKLLLTKEALEDMYLVHNMPMRQIADKCGISVGAVFNRLHEYKIQVKPPHKGMQGKHHTTETKEKISKLNKGSKRSKISCQKISASKKGKVLKPSIYGGHTKMHRSGYILVYLPNHPYATKDGYVFEHILAYEKSHNCVVDRNKYVVHHINEIKIDNRPENLKLMTKSEHMSYHSKKRHMEEK